MEQKNVSRHVRVFIGSSVESLTYAEAIAVSLDYDAECEIWTDSFQPSSETISSLIEKLIWADFGIFILSADDQINSRGHEMVTPRDNVIFELGLFMGGLGKNRVAAVIDRGTPGIRKISDLSGFTFLEYDSTKSNAQNATRAASSHIKQAIRLYGKRHIKLNQRADEPEWFKKPAVGVEE